MGAGKQKIDGSLWKKLTEDIKPIEFKSARPKEDFECEVEYPQFIQPDFPESILMKEGFRWFNTTTRTLYILLKADKKLFNDFQAHQCIAENPSVFTVYKRGNQYFQWVRLHTSVHFFKEDNSSEVYIQKADMSGAYGRFIASLE